MSKEKKKTKKKIGEIALLVCSDCFQEFFMIVNYKGRQVCMACLNKCGGGS